jgi:uncharacterized protein (DUF305 family)
MIQKTSSYRLPLALAAVVLSICAGFAHAQGDPVNMADKTSGSMSGHGSEALRQSMMSGMKQMQDMKVSGDTDKDFAMMMKMHHQQALDMAQVELEHGKSPEMKAMAKKIIAAQKKEIAEFDQWMHMHP